MHCILTDPGDDCGIYLFCSVADASYATVVCMHMEAYISIDL